MKEIFQLDGNLLFLKQWMDSNKQLLCGFSTKLNGTSLEPYTGLNIGTHVGDDDAAVLQNRQLIASQIGLSLDRFIFAQQCHTTTIKKVTKQHIGAGVYAFDTGIASCDGMYTTDPSIVLATFYADCTPLYFYVPSRQLIGVAHAGWKGSVNGIMHQMIQTLKNEEAILPEDIWIAIGPCIGKDAYRVDDIVINPLKQSPVDLTDVYVELNEKEYKFDIKLLNKRQALFEGVPETNIFVSTYCTFADADLFYSYRKNKQTGRMMSFMSLKQ